MKIQRRKNMTTQKHISCTLLTLWIAGCCCGAAMAQGQTKPKKYQVSNLASLGGTSSGGNSINDQSWVAGYSRLPDNLSRHAALWQNGSITDLGTLGGPN